MKTWASKESAEQDRQAGAIKIAELEHATQGRVYIQIKCNLTTLRRALAAKPMAEIISLIAEYDYPKTNREIRAELMRNLNDLIAKNHVDHASAIRGAMDGGRYRSPKDYTAQIAAAKQAIVYFDAANPDILAAIEKERQENIDHHFWD